MGKRPGRSRGLPRWYRGQKYLDDIDGSEIYEGDGSMYYQRGLRISKINYDTLLDSERQDMIDGSR